MSDTTSTRPTPPPPNAADLFTPKLVTALREGYDLGKLRRDAIAGLTVAIVHQTRALPGDDRVHDRHRRDHLCEPDARAFGAHPRRAGAWSPDRQTAGALGGVGTLSAAAVSIAALAIFMIVVTRRLRPGWPDMLFVVVICSIVAAVLGLDVETIGTKFGGIPRTLPAPTLPELSLAKMQAVLPDAIAFTLLGALAGVLAHVAWNMIERPAIRALLRSSSGDFLVLAATFLLTVFRDLTEGIVVGFALGAVLFIHRMSKSIEVTGLPALVQEDVSDRDDERPSDRTTVADDTVIYRISGAFFFGAASAVGAVLERIGDRHRALILDLSQVPLLDSTAANLLEGVARMAQCSGGTLVIAGALRPQRMLLAHGLRTTRTRFAANLEVASDMLRRSRDHG